jgi:hypothetical protein
MMRFYEIRFSKMTTREWILRDGPQGLMIHECYIGIWKTKDLLYYYNLQGGGLLVDGRSQWAWNCSKEFC